MNVSLKDGKQLVRYTKEDDDLVVWCSVIRRILSFSLENRYVNAWSANEESCEKYTRVLNRYAVNTGGLVKQVFSGTRTSVRK